MPSLEEWENQWEATSSSALPAVEQANDLDTLEAVRVDLLGRKGKLTSLLKGLKDLPIEARRSRGPQSNDLKLQIQELIETKRTALERKRIEATLSQDSIDLSLPGKPASRGRSHPITQTIDEIKAIVRRLGFSLADGPLVESDYYNFEALNIPEEHPARDMQDTFYLSGTKTPLLMRTHTSPVQIRHMENNKPPIRIIALGRVFRHEAVDASHSAVFHQMEGLYVDKKVSMADLKATLLALMRGLFGPKAKVRLRASYFPFTEPSVEVDVQWGQSGKWLEMLGAGIVHPNVLKGCGLDPEQWSGFAIGMGVERVAMVRTGITDIRMFYENDTRFLEQF